MRTARNWVALALAATGVYVLTGVRLAGEPIGFLFAFANCALFVLCIVLGHRIAAAGGANGIDRLGLAMLIAMVVAVPIGIRDAATRAGAPGAARSRYRRGNLLIGDPVRLRPARDGATATRHLRLLLSLLPATAAVIGIVVLKQIPSPAEVAAVALVILGVATHREPR